MKYAAFAAIALAVVVCHADEPTPAPVPNNDDLIDNLIKKYLSNADTADKDFLEYLLVNLNKRLAFVGVSEGLKAIIGKFSDATTFEDYRAQLFNDVLPNNPNGTLYMFAYNLGLDLVNIDLKTFNMTTQEFFSEKV